MSDGSPPYRQVLIVGGGPVGLFLAICLHSFNITCVVLEKRKKPRPGSRSIGIHPVSLELFEPFNIAESMIQKGVKISKGFAFANTRKIGEISFESCPKPFNFILSLPQKETELILENYTLNLNQNLLIRGADVTNFDQNEDDVTVSYNQGEDQKKVKSSFIIGCDGKRSPIRKKAGIAFNGRPYPDHYIMGDFEDNTQFGPNAAIFLCDDGLIESFPLPRNKRRWVVKTEDYYTSVDKNLLIQKIKQRTQHDLAGCENTMLSHFGTQKFIAKSMVKNRLVLAGDAAHIVSPIGGQGMNIGWLGAWDLANCLNLVINQQAQYSEVLKGFEKRRMKAAKKAIRRAEINMRLGRSVRFPLLRNSLVSFMLNTPLSRLMARLFIMRGIGRWVI